MYSPGGAWRGRGTSRGDGYALTPPWASKATLFPQEASSSSPRTQGPSHTRSPLLLTLLTSSNFLNPSAHLGKADAALGDGLPTPATCSRPFRALPHPDPPQVPKPGLWGWPQHSARSFSDLVTYRYHSPLLWGSRALHPLGGTLGPPALLGCIARVPAPGTRITRISSWCWEADQAYQVQTRQSLFS